MEGMHMIYCTGDCHGDFKRFNKKNRLKLKYDLMEDDYVIICGDFGFLWIEDKEFQYNLDWMERLPFTILWVQGNHENYNMIKQYPIEMWNGGKVRHIIKDKIILLERGQIFNIQGSTFFTFGGASSHDISGGILDRNDPEFRAKRERAYLLQKPFRILNEEWWTEELPSEEELQEGLNNLEKCGFKVDYVISHCVSNRIQHKLETYYENVLDYQNVLQQDILTDYFDMLEDKLIYKHWFCGHYHEDYEVDDMHTVMYYRIVSLSEYSK